MGLLDDYTPEQIEAAKRAILWKREYARKWHQAHKEVENQKCRERSKRHYESDKERSAEYHRKRYIENIESECQRARAYDHSHREERREYHRTWDKEHPEKRRKYEKATHSRNPSVRKASHARRRARELNAVGSFTPEEFRLLCITYDNRCVYCSRKSVLTPDHKVPLARGGSNLISNIVPACKSCNCSKRDLSYDEFMKKIGNVKRNSQR